MAPSITSGGGAPQDMITIFHQVIAAWTRSIPFVQLVEPRMSWQNIIHHFGIMYASIDAFPEAQTVGLPVDGFNSRV